MGRLVGGGYDRRLVSVVMDQRNDDAKTDKINSHRSPGHRQYSTARLEHAGPTTEASSVQRSDDEEGEQPRAVVVGVDPDGHQAQGKRLGGRGAEVERLAADLVGQVAPEHATGEVAQVEHAGDEVGLVCVLQQ